MTATQVKVASRQERFGSLERTLVLIKPDAVQRGLIGKILSRFEDRGIAIIGMKLMTLDTERAGRHYEAHQGKPFYESLVNYMTSAPIVALALEGVNAITTVRTMMGATNPAEAAPGTMRGDFAQRVDCNIVHGSDSPAAAERELGIFFDEQEILGHDPSFTHWV